MSVPVADGYRRDARPDAGAGETMRDRLTGRLGWTLAVALIVVAPITAGVAIHDVPLVPWALTGSVLAVAVVVGMRIQERGIAARPEAESRDRHTGWTWHHPIAATTSAVLLQAPLLTLYLTLFSFQSDVRWFWRLLPLFATAGVVGAVLGRVIGHRRYEGDDPEIPERWRRPRRTARAPAPRLTDPRDPWV